MALNVDIEPAGPGEKEIVTRLMQLYLHDFSEFAPAGSLHGEIDGSGRFAYLGLASYWEAPRREALLLRASGRLAGFVLVNDWSPSGQPVDCAIAEFFVVRKYRRHGVGTEAARRVITDRPGRWEIAVADYNGPALAFWPKALLQTNVGLVDIIEGAHGRWSGPIYRLNVPQATPQKSL